MNRQTEPIPLVSTIKEKCKVCYTCVRECPAKAIRVYGGQAEVIPERCIGCGNCVRVCSQRAKVVFSSEDKVKELLSSSYNIAACLAPSFPAEFYDYSWDILVGTLRALGFSYVIEVAAGADYVSEKYKEIFSKDKDKHYIASSCPAVVSFIEKYYPRLVKNLSPVVSPMLATAQIVKATYGKETRIVFIGPCIAKKTEAWRNREKVLIDAVLTYTELRNIVEDTITPDMKKAIIPSDFDPPHPGKGMVFPLGGGLLESAELSDDLLSCNIVSTDGNKNFVEIIKDFENKDIQVNLVDVLCCNGCIMGPGFSTKNSQYWRHARVSEYAHMQYEKNSRKNTAQLPDTYDLLTSFKKDDRRLSIPSENIIKEILRNMGKMTEEDELNCGACGYETCREHAIAIHKGLAETQMCLPYTIEKFQETAVKLSASYKQLESTQQALIQSEKLASMGQLAAGIAHELNNPLGVVLLYAHLLYDSIDRNSQTYDDLKMIVEQTDRCKSIVSGLLNFARNNRVFLKKVNINSLISQCLKTLHYPDVITIDFPQKKETLFIDIDEDQMMQVCINIFSNAIEAMPGGGTLSITSEIENSLLHLHIKDTGIGIKEENRKKIFEPFFTTKQMGKGTGLGMSVAYGIIKMHRGSIDLTTNADPQKGPTGTTFTLTIPFNKKTSTIRNEGGNPDGTI